MKFDNNLLATTINDLTGRLFHPRSHEPSTMNRLVIYFLTLSSFLFVSQVHSFDVSKINHAFNIKVKPTVKRNPSNSTWNTKSIESLHISHLASFSKHEKIHIILDKAVTEGSIKSSNYYYYTKKSNEFEYDGFPENLLNCFKVYACKVDTFIHKSTRKPVFGKNTHEKGRFGEHWTAKKMTAMGYEKLHSKLDKIHGIDGIYVQKTASEEIKKIVVTESKVSKVNMSSLVKTPSGKQMSKQWLAEKIERMLVNGDSEVRKTGELLKNNLEKIEKQLWEFDVYLGVVQVFRLDDAANKVGKVIPSYQSEAILDALLKKAGDS